MERARITAAAEEGPLQGGGGRIAARSGERAGRSAPRRTCRLGVRRGWA
eukprot:CAMPEP_0177603278 /NCGR_PEP_ID=MMETSP0419_2-20121207/15419_1 /TAXON_ID=582737 /ORGANISM="Tetraselmis sp., Strain GSL018" /LENGTH=48 /DNA_ID= /DNA_START= /DNA_END= /DNA_ORIENTATION=